MLVTSVSWWMLMKTDNSLLALLNCRDENGRALSELEEHARARGARELSGGCPEPWDRRGQTLVGCVALGPVGRMIAQSLASGPSFRPSPTSSKSTFRHGPGLRVGTAAIALTFGA